MAAAGRHSLIEAELPQKPDVSSSHRPWSGITVQIHHWRRPGEAVSAPQDHDILAMRYLGHANLEQRRLGRTHRGIVVPGNLGLHPRGVESRWRWDRPGSIVISRIPTSMLIEASAQRLRDDEEEVVLRNCFGARDPLVESVLNLLARELSLPEHPVQLLVAEHLSCALAAHLVHRFNANVGRLAPSRGALHPSALSRVLDFIHGSPDADITLTDLASIAQVSRFHFSRLFKRSTGNSPMAYLERVRMLRARELLSVPRTSIASVAAMTGFTDQSHFGRRFKLYFGCSPSNYVSQITRSSG